MPTVADIFRLHGQSYLDRFAETIPSQHRKVIRAITDCRTERSGILIYRCEDCGRPIDLFLSCGNRHCPTCQHDKTKLWLNRRIDQLLPVPHFMIAFTVPAALRDFLRSHQRLGYSALFLASSTTLRRLASEPTYFPGDLPGFFGVLHTWGRTLQYHPHIHYVVPGGAFNTQTHTFHSSPEAFFLPVRVMSKLVKSLFYRQMKKSGLLSLIPAKAFKQPWNVNSQPVGNGVHTLHYLSAYVFRTGISDTRIVSLTDSEVHFSYTDTKTGTEKLANLHTFEFIRRFLQHVLPSGFMKIRYYGFLHPCSSIPLKLAVALLEAWHGVVSTARKEPPAERRKPPFCPHCHGHLHYLRFILPLGSPTAGFT